MELTALKKMMPLLQRDRYFSNSFCKGEIKLINRLIQAARLLPFLIHQGFYYPP
jgi:hypothetical protein